MGPFLKKQFANPSALYKEGVLAKKFLEEFRLRTARVVGALKDEIVFTGSGTEADNLALFGVFDLHLGRIKKPHLIVSQIEHPAVLEAARKIEKLGGRVTYLPVDGEGIVDVKVLAKALRRDTVLVSIMHSNNEIGTVQNVREIAKEIRRFKKNKTNNKNLPYFHTDASQSANYFKLNVEKLGVDMMTLDGSKIYGPKGVGMLFVKRGSEISPQIIGGGQENKMRSGTENIANIAGFAKALEIAQDTSEKEAKRLTTLRDYCTREITKRYPKAEINGSNEKRLPNNVNVCFPGIDGEFAVIKLDVLGVACSSSSSCRTLSENTSSYVIDALGKKRCRESSLRFTLGRTTTKQEINALLEALSFLA